MSWRCEEHGVNVAEGAICFYCLEERPKVMQAQLDRIEEMLKALIQHESLESLLEDLSEGIAVG